MIFEIVISKQADFDLRGIFEYIAYELRSSQNASGQLDRLEKGILSLEEMPERHRKYEKEHWHSRGLRVMPVDNYVVFYISDKDTQQVTVIRVMYAERNVEEQLTKYTEVKENMICMHCWNG